MEIKDEILILLAIATLVLAIYSVFNINHFMKAEALCETGFEIINRCGCIPDFGYSKLLHDERFKNLELGNLTGQLNISLFKDGD